MTRVSVVGAENGCKLFGQTRREVQKEGVSRDESCADCGGEPIAALISSIGDDFDDSFLLSARSST